MKEQLRPEVLEVFVEWKTKTEKIRYRRALAIEFD